MFIAAMNAIPLTFVGFGALISSNLLKYVLISNQECKVRPVTVNINSNKPLFYHNSITVNKCSGSCHDFINPFAKSCISDVVKNMNIKKFNVISRTNENMLYILTWDLYM